MTWKLSAVKGVGYVSAFEGARGEAALDGQHGAIVYYASSRSWQLGPVYADVIDDGQSIRRPGLTCALDALAGGRGRGNGHRKS